jgi:hypothetical protein
LVLTMPAPRLPLLTQAFATHPIDPLKVPLAVQTNTEASPAYPRAHLTLHLSPVLFPEHALFSMPMPAMLATSHLLGAQAIDPLKLPVGLQV